MRTVNCMSFIMDVIHGSRPFIAPDVDICSLHNFQIQRIKTSHAFYTDVDLLPSRGLYRKLHAAKENHAEEFLDPLSAVVVPAFELSDSKITRSMRGCTPSKEQADRVIGAYRGKAGYADTDNATKHCIARQMPHTFEDLALCANARDCRQFDIWNKAGHDSTGTNTWKHQQGRSTLKTLKCMKR